MNRGVVAAKKTGRDHKGLELRARRVKLRAWSGGTAGHSGTKPA